MENIRFHQGDVIGASIDAIPASAIMVKNRPLAISDRTKHAHVLTGNVERQRGIDTSACIIVIYGR